ncbi:heme o synthase [Kushneria phosphatilytica]|uniref:Protoheme IX farnesyltransferase n=1 Tax=Kushneria phosphatilytica TaxID=657387 RepID=A0A1S1NWP3_9GAMM|nr:heme o synthase [Kushneria phosphatilytica]OHV11553.1 protoheme IX farnesyltransferase [Kushneria phosphatilytica]QEL12161.1 protoheme IX farnesyltransferase [Kushneria phosphatilytica]
MFRKYLHLAKPGIVAGNLITVTGGFLLASRGDIDPLLLLATVIGVSLVVASGCVLNNIIDRDIDRLMERTKGRSLVQGTVDVRVALLYAIVMGLAGFALLAFGANLLAAGVALIGFLIYVGLYSLWVKRHTVHGTVIGSFSGASPPVIGYCAVTGHFDVGALLLLVIFSLWQMPHSYAIAIFRYDDYAAAAIPVLPVRQGIASARRHIIGYIVAFIAASLLLTLSGYTGYLYFVIAALVGGYWLKLALADREGNDARGWAKRVFLCSILVVTMLSIAMSVDFAPRGLTPASA